MPSAGKVEAEDATTMRPLIHGLGSGTPTSIGAFDEQLRTAERLIYLRKYSQAVTFLSALRDTHVNEDPRILDTCVRAELLAGYYQSGYADALERAAHLQADATYELLYLSLAGAECGKIAQGQARFCLDCIKGQSSTLIRLGGNSPRLGDEESPKEVALLSALALGLRYPADFDELALKIDPGNELATRALIDYYAGTRRYTDLRRVAKVAGQRSASPAVRSFCLRSLAANAGRKDDPIDRPKEVARRKTS